MIQVAGTATSRLLSILREHGVTRAGIFGSQVSGTAGPDSDVDIVVEFEPGRSLLDLVGLQDALTAALGRKADVTTYNALHPLLRDRILAQEHRIL